MKLKNYALCMLAGLIFSTSVHAFTKEEVEKRGFLQCGVSTGSPGFSTVDAMGKWAGLDVDMCRAVAAAIFDDAEKVAQLTINAIEKNKKDYFIGFPEKLYVRINGLSPRQVDSGVEKQIRLLKHYLQS